MLDPGDPEDSSVVPPGGSEPPMSGQDDGTSDEEDLEAGLLGLSGMLSEHWGLEKTLVRIAQFAVHAIPGADGAGLALLEEDRPQTVVATAEFVREIDALQYELDEGPCLTAVATRRTVTVGDLGGERRWRRFGPRVGRMGVHSALSLPLLLAEGSPRVEGPLGALNVYARGKHAFDDNAVRLGEEFAPHAAINVFNAQLLAKAERSIGDLQRALVNRATIDQAIGAIMSLDGGTPHDAFSPLRSLSQSRHEKLAQVASRVLAEAVRRAPTDDPGGFLSDGAPA
jgi:hypothetical protein